MGEEANGGGAGSGGQAGGGQAGGGAGGGGGGDDWYAPLGLDDGARQFIAGKGFTSAAEWAKSHMEADRLVRERNVLPAPDADPAKRGEWPGWEALGWSKDRAKYTVEPVKVPEGKHYSGEMEKAFLDAAHEARVPASAAKAILDKVANFGFAAQDAQVASGAKALADVKDALKKEWGNDYGVNEERARAAAKHLGLGAEDASQLEKIVGAPGLLKLFAKIGAMLGEDTLKGGAAGGGSGGGGLTPDGAAAEMNRLAADKEWTRSMRDITHPQHKQNKDRWNDLIALKNRM